jgi:drug/metabolite transporter (DMT)-like permease
VRALKQEHPDAPLRALLFMLTGALLFAVMNTLAHGLNRIPWPMLGFSRAFLGLIASLTLARVRGVSLHITDRRRMWHRSIAGSTGMVCTFYALTHMPVADATALLNTTPLWIALMAWLLLGERPSWRVLVALVVAMVGVVLVQRPSSMGGAGWAGVVALCAGCASALAMVSLRKLKGETPEAVVVSFSAVATAVMAVATGHWMLTRPFPGSVSATEIVCVLAMGLTATLGQLSITKAYALDKAARVGVAGWLQVVIAMVIDGVVFRHFPKGLVVTGIVLLLASGVLLVADAQREEASKS